MSLFIKKYQPFFSLFKTTDVKSNIAVLDGVRAIACLSVISYHINRFTLLSHLWSFSLGPLTASVAMSGWSGVTLFFVLSGFLLFMPYAKALLFTEVHAHWPSMLQFYTRRALRILPGYYVSLFLLIIFTQPHYLQIDHLKQLGLFLTLFMDGSHSTYQQIDGPFWTLAVEWQFYLLLPFIALAFRWIVQRGSPRRRLVTLIGCLLVMIAWGVATRYWGRYYMYYHPEAKGTMPQPIFSIALFFLYGTDGKYLEDFAVGMLVSTLFIYAQRAYVENTLRLSLQRASMWLWGIGLLGLLFVASWNIFPPLRVVEPYVGAHNWLVEISLALSYGLCITAILFGPVGLQQLFSWSALRHVGFMSYSLYIWHIPILLWFMANIVPYTQHWRHSAAYSLYWVCVALVIMPFSYLFYRMIEQPWITIAHKLRRQEAKTHDTYNATASPARVRGE